MSDRLVAQRIADSACPGATVEPLLVSENATFRVRGGHRPAVLRLHRPGYVGDAAIASELAWIAALRRDTTVSVVEPLSGVLIDPSTGRRAVLFAELPGGPVPDEALDVAHFAALGEIAGAFHDHAESWRRPAAFSRFTWGVAETIGPRPRWGSWRDGLAVGEAHRRAIAPAAASSVRVGSGGSGAAAGVSPRCTARRSSSALNAIALGLPGPLTIAKAPNPSSRSPIIPAE